ncbi:hypothetical protein [Enterococcus sp. DIV0240a]|uniref:hypothetical protein n=1 Tax=Enterococcus sp. DIV0240a TaxID=2774651 RepID=UPI003D2C6BED
MAQKNIETKDERERLYKDDEELQLKISRTLGFAPSRKYDHRNTCLYICRKIFQEANSNTAFLKLGWRAPEDMPEYETIRMASVGTSSFSRYNNDLFEQNNQRIEYDFVQAYKQIITRFFLPTNVFLEKAYKAETAEEKTEKFLRHMQPLFETTDLTSKGFVVSPFKPTEDKKFLNTFTFLRCEIRGGRPKEETFIGNDDNSSNALLSGKRTVHNQLLFGKSLIGEYYLSEVEIKQIHDYYNIDLYDIRQFKVLDTYTFRTAMGVADEYYNEIEKIKEIDHPLAERFYKDVRNYFHGFVGSNKGDVKNYTKTMFGKDNIKDLKARSKALGNAGVFSKAYQNALYSIWRDLLLRYEQKYVNQGLLAIKTDALVFDREIPEFEALTRAGVVRKKIIE